MKKIVDMNTVVAEAMDELNGVWEMMPVSDLFDTASDYDLEEEQRKANKTYAGEYTLCINGREVARVWATCNSDAIWQGYDRYGVDFIGGSVKCDEQNCWACEAVFDYWTYGDENVTKEEVVAFCKARAYAWANFTKIAYYDYDEDNERCVSLDLCEEGKDFIRRHGGRLAQKYDR